MGYRLKTSFYKGKVRQVFTQEKVLEFSTWTNNTDEDRKCRRKEKDKWRVKEKGKNRMDKREGIGMKREKVNFGERLPIGESWRAKELRRKREGDN